MKHVLSLMLLLGVLALISTPAVSGERADRTDKAVLFSLSGFSDFSVKSYEKGAGFRYFTDPEWFLTVSLGFTSNDEESHTSGSIGLYKGWFATSNTAFYTGAVLGAQEHSYEFSAVGLVEWLPYDHIGLDASYALTYDKLVKEWSIHPSGAFTLAVYF